MPVTPPPAGQALMTVLEGTGYKLVAASPALSAEDRTHFARMPQVSDYLHLESSPRVFFSYYRLPGGGLCGDCCFDRPPGTRSRRGPRS